MLVSKHHMMTVYKFDYLTELHSTVVFSLRSTSWSFLGEVMDRAATEPTKAVRVRAKRIVIASDRM